MRYLCLLRNQREMTNGAIVSVGKSRLAVLNMGMRTLVMVKIFHQHHIAEGNEHYPCKQTIYPLCRLCHKTSDSKSAAKLLLIFDIRKKNRKKMLSGVVLLDFSGHSHERFLGYGCGGDVGSADRLLRAFDVELHRCAVAAHIQGDACSHDQRQVHAAVSGGETAQYGDVIRRQHLVEHGFTARESELAAAAGEVAEDNAAATVQYAIELQDAHLAVHVVHGLADFFHEEDEAVKACRVGLCADVGRKRADVTAYQYAFGVSLDAQHSLRG